MLRRLCIRFLPATVALRFAVFFMFLPAATSSAICAPVVSARFPKSDSTSSDQRGNQSEETTEQTSKPVPPLDTSAGKVGQCPTHVQSCCRRCAVRPGSNRRIAIRNHASNRRWRRLVQTTNEPTMRDWRCCRPTKRRTRVCRADRRTMSTLSYSSRAR